MSLIGAGAPLGRTEKGEGRAYKTRSVLLRPENVSTKPSLWLGVNVNIYMLRAHPQDPRDTRRKIKEYTYYYTYCHYRSERYD